jgi:maltose alpha-D-glucosyltransferase/alpha-amylase
MSLASNEVAGTGRAVSSTEKDVFWYKKAIIYELHVRSFYDSNADGIGDFPGLTQKLDYLQELGITAIWLLPFYPSPLRDDGYDIADYYSINPIYGTLEQFKTFLRAAHDRGLRVITELVINHTSDQNPWFQRARRSPPGSNYRDYYVWSDDPRKYKEARIIFKDFEPSNWTWDPVANSYYWHRFFYHQPDLNFDNPEIHREILRILDFWLDIGVDGMRLDAIPYLYEREGTSCESLPETHAFLKKLRAHVDEKYGDRVFLAEANQWPEDSAAYFGEGRGDECHVAFHFPLMPRLFMSVRMEDRFPIIDILNQTPPIPETSAWAIFLRNHDELTLEMVTDEERDYMYRMYATDTRARINLGIRRRLAPLLGNDRRKIELLNMLLLSLPGTPVIYYGDEIGMGDNTFLKDRDGVRTPMHWSSDKNAGFSKGSPHSLVFPVIVDPEYHYETVNVETQLRNPNSLLWWTRRVLALKQRSKALSEGQLEFLHPVNRKVLVYLLKSEGETVLVVANLSRHGQPLSLDLQAYKDFIPVEMFGQAAFPEVTTQPYNLTLSPYAAFWFLLEPKSALAVKDLSSLPPILINRDWQELFDLKRIALLEKRLPLFLKQQPWFAGRKRTISTSKITRIIEYRGGIVLALLSVDFNETDPEEYLLPLALEDERLSPIEKLPHVFLARLQFGDGRTARLFDASGAPEFWRDWLQFIAAGEPIHRDETSLTPFGDVVSAERLQGAPEILLKPFQNNSSSLLAEYFAKLLRRVEPGINPELEIGHFLSRRGFPNIAPVLGGVHFESETRQKYTFGIVSARVPNARTAWDFTYDALTRYFDRALSAETIPEPISDLGGVIESEPGSLEDRFLGAYSESARLLGTRTAELHLALASEQTDADMAPELFSPFSQRSLYQSMRNLVLRTLQLMNSRSGQLSNEVAELGAQVAARETELTEHLKGIYQHPLNSVRSRIHGNLHLAQVLHTGKDFVFIDFEGEPEETYGERRIKRSPVKDLAGMLRSYHHVSHVALHDLAAFGKVLPENVAAFEGWGRYWRRWISAIFLRSYRERVRDSNLVPRDDLPFRTLLRAYLVETAFAELSEALLNTPGKVEVALCGILEILAKPV